jgi:hypothetical protein
VDKDFQRRFGQEKKSRPTSRETILTALQARFSAHPAMALRGEALPERIPADGLLSPIADVLRR